MKTVEYLWQGRSLTNYKDMHEKTAKSKGCWEQLKKCNTLTEARKIVFGVKKGNKEKSR
jgi:hypothetical protein